MQDIFIGRQPIYNRDIELHAYELLYRSNKNQNQANVIDHDRATAEVVLNAFMEFGLDHLVGDKPAFINLPRSFVVGDLPIPFTNEQVVLEILEDITVDGQIIDAVQTLREAGYTIALDDFVFHDSLRPLVENSAIIKIDIMALPREKVVEHVAELRNYPVSLLAEKVESHDDFAFARALGFDYFQGYFFCRPKVITGKTVTSHRLSLLRLLAELQNPDPRLNEITKLVSQDIALSYKLLRRLNSAAYALPRPIESIHYAIVFLGLQHIKQWIALIALSKVPDKPDELMALSLTRARMCERLARAGRGNVETHFTVGLFSVLDALLDTPMEELLLQLPLDRELKAALLHHEGPAGRALSCAQAFEHGAWESAHYGNLSPDQITDAYLNAVIWADELQASLAA